MIYVILLSYNDADTACLEKNKTDKVHDDNKFEIQKKKKKFPFKLKLCVTMFIYLPQLEMVRN